MAHEMKRNDTDPTYVAECQDKNGVGVDISQAQSISFYMTPSVKDEDGSPPADGAALKVKAAARVYVDPDGTTHPTFMEYPWVPEDVDTAGGFATEVEVVLESGRKRTFPTKGFGHVSIYPDLGEPS